MKNLFQQYVQVRVRLRVCASVSAWMRVCVFVFLCILIFLRTMLSLAFS